MVYNEYIKALIIRKGWWYNMSKLNDFDLDVKVTKSKGGVNKPMVTSWFLCTPGSCYDDCPHTSTFASNCCNDSVHNCA